VHKEREEELESQIIRWNLPFTFT